MDILEIFSYAFIKRALISGTLISLCAALLGVPLILKKYSMIGDGLSHVGFGAVAIALALNTSPLYIAMPVVLIAAFLLLKLNSDSRINGDAAIALVSVSSIAIGVTISSLNMGINTDIDSLMFGSILAISHSDMILSIIISLFVILIFILSFNKIFLVTFDENFGKASGVNSDFYNMVIAVLTALTIVIGMRIMGALLISGLIIFPALTAMRLFKSFKGVTICSAVVSVICFIFGMSISAFFSLPAGASIVIINLIVFIVAFIFEKIRG